MRITFAKMSNASDQPSNGLFMKIVKLASVAFAATAPVGGWAGDYPIRHKSDRTAGSRVAERSNHIRTKRRGAFEGSRLRLCQFVPGPAVRAVEVIGQETCLRWNESMRPIDASLLVLPPPQERKHFHAPRSPAR
jgi:hypothetical protein